MLAVLIPRWAKLLGALLASCGLFVLLPAGAATAVGDPSSTLPADVVSLTLAPGLRAVPYAATFATLTAPGSGVVEVQRRLATASTASTSATSATWQRMSALSLDEAHAASGAGVPVALWAPGAGVWQFRALRDSTPGTSGAQSVTVSVTVQGSAPAWLRTLNTLRAQAGSPPAYWNPRADADALLHARWMVRNRAVCHCEVPGTPLYSAKGDAVGSLSWISLGALDYAPVRDAASGVQALAAAPFHSLGMLAETLRGVSLATSNNGSVASVVVYGVDVARIGGFGAGGETGGVAPVVATPPLTYPGDGAVLPAAFARSPSESPDPLTVCGRGYAPGVSGAPLWVSWGLRATAVAHPVPAVALQSATLTSDGVRLAACAYDAAHYRGANAGETAYAQSVLAPYQGVVVVPKAPLLPGRTYTATVRTNLGTRTWSFRVGS